MCTKEVMHPIEKWSDIFVKNAIQSWETAKMFGYLRKNRIRKQKKQTQKQQTARKSNLLRTPNN